MSGPRTTARATTGRADPTGRPAARRTMLALLASALGVMPLKALLSDSRWLLEGWVAMAIVLGTAALLRLRRPAGALDVWAGVLLLVPWLTRAYVPQHALWGFLPTGRTLHDVATLMDSLHHTTASEVAPIHSTVAVRLVVSALVGLLAALIDLVAVVGRRGGLAGVPLLVVYTVSGAVPRSPVAWYWFVPTAVGYLILLAIDAADDVRDWGLRVSHAGETGGRPPGLTFSAQRIGVLAVLAAIVLPLLVPSQPKNLIADAFHKHGGGGGVGSIGASTGGTSIDPFIELKGQLERDRPVPLMTVHVDAPAGVQPFYVRTNVLDRFTGNGWIAGGHGSTQPVEAGAFDTIPVTAQPRTVNYQATVTITGLGGNAPVFSVPRAIQGVDQNTTWSPQDQILLGADVRSGEQFIEIVAQPQPTLADLEATPELSGQDMSRWLQLPALPAYVTRLVNRLTTGLRTPFDKARAIFNFFADPANRFVYSLRTAAGDSGSDLVDFLQHRTGFCQQYAAAMGVMLRAAGVPARIVLGYMHAPPDSRGDFSVSTFDAHAWVEAFFPGAGWIPFDPTPPAGLVGGRQSDLPWARHVFATEGQQGPTASLSSTASAPTTAPTGRGHGLPPAPAAHSAPYGQLLAAVGILLGAVLLALVPAAVRAGRRRRRLTLARRGDPDPLWAELSDTAVDLGYVWSPSRSPRQVYAWLAADAADTAPSLEALASAVEQRRYARQAPAQDMRALADGLADVSDRLWSRRSRRARLRARLWPASLGWSARLGALRRRH